MKHPRVFAQRWPYWLALLLVAGIAARIAMPFAMKFWLNERLAALGNYRGHVEEVHIALWRGAYELHGVHIRQLNSAVDEPLFATPALEVQVLWSALARGTIVARIRALEPTISFAAGHAGKAAQTGRGVNWADLLVRLTPFRIDRLEIVSGQVHYYDFYSKPKVDMHLDNVDAVLSNLTNAGDQQGRRVAGLRLEALAMAQSKLSLDLQIDPFAAEPDFDLRMKLLGLQVARMRPVMQAYTPFDPTEGKLDVLLEASGKDGAVEGYIKPLFTDLKVVDWKQELRGEHNPFELAVNAVGSVLNLLLQNQAKDQLATRMPFSGRLDAPDVDIATSLVNILNNAFISAFEPQFERSAKSK